MHTAHWIVVGLLSVLFAAGGLYKLAQPKEKLASTGMAWTEDFSAAQVKAIGAVEVLTALGMSLPAVFGVASGLTRVAAAGLALTMVGAALTHLRRHEAGAIPVNMVLGGLAVFVAATSAGAT